MADESNNITSGGRSSGIVARDFDAPGQSSSADVDHSSTVAHSSSPVSTATAAYTAARAGVKKAWWHSQFNLMLAVFALLAATALLFVALAPPPELQIATPEPAAVLTISDEEAPWSQSQLAEARTNSQDILKNLLDSKKDLEEKGVQDWANAGFEQALALAAEGDEAYKQQDYQVAIGKYEAAVQKMDSLFEFLPRQIQLNLQEGRAALTEGKSELAKEKFNRVLELDESNLEATAGLDRAGRLDQVLELLAQAKSDEAAYEQSNDLADLRNAESKLEQAKQLDGEFAPLAESVQRVQLAIRDKQFNSAMSDAYRALFASQYNTARKSFARALKIKPGDASAARAMQQALASDQSASISTLLANAKRYEGQEEWASAQSNYQTVLQRDPNQVGAKLGNIRSGARLQLDNQLEEMLADPLALARTERKDKATAVLKDAVAISSKGPRLNGQIEQLQAALQQTDAVVKVSFVSDNATQVTLQKIGSKPINLGQFQRKNLALKPGRYVATGVRLGFQDVRTDIELVPGASVQSFTVKCDEAVRVSSVSGG